MIKLKKDEKDDDYVKYYNIQIIATWLTMLGNSITLIGRVKWMFGLPAIVFVPLILSKVRNRNTKILYFLGIIIIFIIYAEVVVGIKGSYGVIPYKSVKGDEKWMI